MGSPIHLSGADPGFRRGGFVHSEGGGVRTGISGADPNCCRALGKSTSKQKLQTAVGGASDHPQKKPVSAPACGQAQSVRLRDTETRVLISSSAK